MKTVGLLLLALAAAGVVPAVAQTSQPSTPVASTDGSEGIEIGSYVFGAVRARSIGPAIMSGRVSCLDVVDDNPRVIYVGAASGGVWKSTNAGVNFSPVFDDHPQCIGSITIDQARPDTVWVGTGEVWVRNSVSVGTGLYKTVDGGEKWKCVGFEDSERIAEIIIHPKDPDVVWVAVLGHLWNANEQRGLYKTTDGGETWRRVLYVNDSTGCTDIAIDPKKPKVLYAAMWQFRRQADFFTSGGPGSGLYKSTDGGESWKQLTDGLPEGELGRIALAVSPAEPERVYATVEAEKSALYRSENRGKQWTRISDGSAVKGRPFYFSLLIADPQDPDRIYKTSTLLHYSRDGGKTFNIVGGRVHVDYHAMWINPRDPHHIIVGNDGGAYVTYNRGGGWIHMGTLPISQFYRVSVDDADPYNVYGGLQDNGSWMAPSRSPSGIRNRDWEVLGGGDGFAVHVDRKNPDLVYWEYQGGNILRRHMSTGESKEIKPTPAADEPDYRFNWNTPIALSPSDPERLYAGSQFLHRSLDHGESWQRISDDLTTDDKQKQRQLESGGLTIDNTTAENHCTLFSICESPLDKQVIWVGTDDGNVQVTDSDGASWRKVNDAIDGVPACTWVSFIEASWHERETAFVVFDGHYTGDMETYVYRTRDLGASWQRLDTDQVEGFARVIRQDPVNPDLLYLGTEFGLYITLDGGRHWARFEEDLPQAAIHDLAIQHRESALVIGTHGRGVYIIDDVRPLRQLTREALAADIVLLESPPSILRVPRFGTAPYGDNQFVGSNPREYGKIVYYLKQRHMFGPMNIEIFDPEGELLKTLPAGKRKGINVVNWRMRLKPPRVPPSSTLDPMTSFAAAFGPEAPAGTYTYVLTKSEQTYSGTLDLVYDPDSPHSAEDRAAQQEVVRQLYALQSRLGYVSDAMKEVRDDARERVEELAGEDVTTEDTSSEDPLQTALETFADQVDEMISSIMVTEEVQGIHGDRKLREKVLRLYGTVIGYGGRPTSSQVELLAVLEAEVERVNTEFMALVDEQLSALNEQLREQQLAPIELLSEEEFAERDN